MRSLFAVVLFHLVCTDVIVVNADLPKIASKASGDGWGRRARDESADRNAGVCRQVECPLGGGDLLGIDIDTERAGLFTRSTAPFIDIRQVLPDPFFCAGEVAPGKLNRLAVRAAEVRDDRVVCGAGLFLRPEFDREVAVAIKAELRFLVPN